MAITIAELWERGKYEALYGSHAKETILLIVLVGVALGAFACGRLSMGADYEAPIVLGRTMPEKISRATTSEPVAQNMPTPDKGQGRAAPVSGGVVVASKNSTKYHLPWCSGAKTIKEENKIWFASEAEAQTAGYTKAENCK